MNETSVTFLLALIFLSILEYSRSSAVDPYYEACKPTKCGVMNVTYPFFEATRQPSYCGEQGFEILCKDGRYPTVNLSGDWYNITNISYKYQSLQVVNYALLDTNSCPSSIHNLTLGSRKPNYLYSGSQGQFLLLRNCTKEISQNVSSEYKFDCGGGGETIAVDGTYLNRTSEFGKLCKGGVVIVPYQKDEEEVVAAGQTDIKKTLAKGVSLNWEANNCSRCEESGGRCGYLESTSEFKCFCQDRPHSSSCHPDETNDKRRTIILAAVISGAVTLAAIALIIFWRRRKIKQASFKNMERNLDYTETDLEMNSSMIYGVPVFSYEELKVATNNFDGKKELGEGGFGTVYHGKLNDGREVAVKRLYEKNYKRIEQFINEINILTTLRHQNLVTLYGCTSRHSRELLLVYEFIPNGTVADHLNGHKATSKSLPWPIRMSIAIETASALAYLHAKEVIHRDVKTNNILLDNNFTVKVADFGLSRLFPSDMSHVSTAPQGTPGYVDPEYHQCYHLTDKSDVYSFGVVLVELISSLPAVDVDRHRHEINLSNYAMNRIQSSAFNDLVDPTLGFESDFKVRRMTTLVAELAFRCLQHERDVRPSMKEVLETLERIQRADYGALEAEEMRKNKAGAGVGPETASSGSTNPPPPSPAESDDVGLLRNAHQQPPPSPNSVMDNWASKNTTPNTSNSGLT